VETQTDARPRHKTTTFYVGDSSDDDDASDADSDFAASAATVMAAVETQTDDSVEYHINAEPRPPRPLGECLAILRSQVCDPLSGQFADKPTRRLVNSPTSITE